MAVRPAKTDDLDAVMGLYATAGARALCPAPTRAAVQRAIAAGELFVLTGGESDAAEHLAACVVLNHEQPPEYAQVAWRAGAESGRALVVHALCVAPAARRHGCASGLLRFSLERARGCGCAAVRLDVWGSNGAARALYEKLGFICAGTVPTIVDGRPDKQLFFERETSQNGTVGTVPTVPPRPSDATSWPPMQHQH